MFTRQFRARMVARQETSVIGHYKGRDPVGGATGVRYAQPTSAKSAYCLTSVMEYRRDLLKQLVASVNELNLPPDLTSPAQD